MIRHAKNIIKFTKRNFTMYTKEELHNSCKIISFPIGRDPIKKTSSFFKTNNIHR